MFLPKELIIFPAMCAAQMGIRLFELEGFHSPGQHAFHRGRACGRRRGASAVLRPRSLHHPSSLAAPGLSVSPAHPEHRNSRLGTVSRQHSIVTTRLRHAHRLWTPVSPAPLHPSPCVTRPHTPLLLPRSPLIAQSRSVCTQCPTPVHGVAFRGFSCPWSTTV